MNTSAHAYATPSAWIKSERAVELIVEDANGKRVEYRLSAEEAKTLAEELLAAANEPCAMEKITHD